MRTKKELTRGEWADVVLVLTIILGFLVRIFPILLVQFPLNDGGLFYTMSRDLRSNHFLIPNVTTYNSSGIPFAYPPLGFYIAGLFEAIGVAGIQVFLWLPLLVSVLAIPAFYILAKTLLNDDQPLAAMATSIFALTPGSYGAQIEGGGLTRSLGVLCFTLFIYSLYQFFHITNRKYFLFSILSGTLAVLSHPEVALAALSGGMLLSLFYAHDWKRILLTLGIALGVLLFTAPWWLTVISSHGLDPWLSVVQSGDYGTSPWVLLYFDFLAPGSLFTVFGVLRMAGLIWSLRKPNFFLIAWMLIPYFVEPRSAGGISYFSSCIFIAIGLGLAIPEAVNWFAHKLRKTGSTQDFTQSRWVTLVLFGLTLYWFILGTFFDFSLANGSLKPPYAQEAFAWVRENTPSDSIFLVLTGNPEGLMSEPIVEWFPALAERRSLTTPQGLEWTLGGQFFSYLNQLKVLHSCKEITCVENWAMSTKSDYSYILLSKTPLTSDLLTSINRNQNYLLVYENPKYAVYRK